MKKNKRLYFHKIPILIRPEVPKNTAYFISCDFGYDRSDHMVDALRYAMINLKPVEKLTLWQKIKLFFKKFLERRTP